MHTFSEWKKLIKDRLFRKEEVPKIVKRCPRCQELSLMYEDKKIVCRKCGFEQVIVE